jgi:hypothetical protein
MTLELVDLNRVPGYAGPLHALRNPELADRFHFWRGASGRRYACTRFPVGHVPAFENAIALYVRRRGRDTVVTGIGTGTRRDAVPLGTDEVHLHLVQGGEDAFATAWEDLAALVIRRAPLYVIERQAA